MMRQSEFKRKYDPKLGKYTKQHIYGEGIVDSLKSFFKPTTKTSQLPPPKPTKKFDQPSSSAANKKAGDDIVKLLSRESPAPAGRTPKKMTQQEINNRYFKLCLVGAKLYNYK